MATFTLRKPVPTGVVIGPLMATLFLRMESERGLRQRRAVLVDEVGAGLGDLPGDVDAGRLDDAAHRGRELGADAVAGDECHGVLGHAVVPPVSVAAHSVRQRTVATGARTRRALAIVREAARSRPCSRSTKPASRRLADAVPVRTGLGAAADSRRRYAFFLPRFLGAAATMLDARRLSRPLPFSASNAMRSAAASLTSSDAPPVTSTMMLVSIAGNSASPW